MNNNVSRIFFCQALEAPGSLSIGRKILPKIPNQRKISTMEPAVGENLLEFSSSEQVVKFSVKFLYPVVYISFSIVYSAYYSTI